MTATTPPNLPVLALVRDLLFASKITGTARTLGTTVTIVRDPARLAGQLGRRLLVDLTLDGAIDAAAQWHKQTGLDVIGFAGHVDTETLTRAHQAGIPKIVSKGQFVQMLAGLVN
jgi:hypothetical protein